MKNISEKNKMDQDNVEFWIYPMPSKVKVE